MSDGAARTDGYSARYRDSAAAEATDTGERTGAGGVEGRQAVVALTQERRGHGVSTAAYYLGRVLVSQGLRVLLVDLSGRRARISSLVARGPTKNLVLWTPNLARATEIAPALDQARRQTAGKADVILLDVDAATLREAGGFALGLSYVVAVTEANEAGFDAADRIAERLGDEQPPYGRVGALLSRVSPDAAGELPAQTEKRRLPILGYFPADYLLAGGADYSLKGGDSSWPHDSYLYALLRLGQTLTSLVPLRRVQRGGVTSALASGQPGASDGYAGNATA